MKKITYLIVALAIVSCSSSDDDGGEGTLPEETFNYFPLTQNTYWAYDTESEQAGAARDSLYVVGVEEINGVLNTVLGAQDPTSGFMTTLLSQSLVRATNTSLLLNGELGAPPVEGFPEITIPLVDVRLFDSEAAVGEVLNEISGEIEQTVQDIPLVIGYTITTVQKETFENGYGGFSQVISSDLIVNLSINAVIIFNDFPITIPIMQAQDVITVTNYYADEIGLIDSNTLIEYELEDLSDLGIELPIPQQDSQIATQVIDTYNIAD